MPGRRNDRYLKKTQRPVFTDNVIKLSCMSFRASALRRAKSRLRRLRFARRYGARLAWESPHKKEIATTSLRTGFAMTPN